jgi:hypothetical protein
VVGHDLAGDEAVELGARRADPADAQAAPGELAERADGHDPVARVEGRQRRRHALPRRRPGQVLDEEEPVLRGERGELPPAGGRHDDAGRVVEGRDDVAEADGTTRGEQAHDLDPDAVPVERDGDEAVAGRAEGVDGADVGRVLDENRSRPVPPSC